VEQKKPQSASKLYPWGNESRSYNRMPFVYSTKHPICFTSVFCKRISKKQYQTIPLKELTLFAPVPAPGGSESGRGSKSWLKVAGGITPLIAKQYLLNNRKAGTQSTKLIWIFIGQGL
jgi:hypothetical protein